MADLLQKVAILFLGVTAAAEPDVFSHRLHLKLVKDCATCHTRAAQSSAVADNLRPEAASCTNCHKQVRIGSPRPAPVAKFSHKQHLAMGNVAPVIAAALKAGKHLRPQPGLAQSLAGANACSACHHGIESSERPDGKAFPDMGDCVVCHTKIDPPFTCVKCHTEGQNLMPTSHVRGFMDLHATGKAKLDKPSCAVCHGTRVTCGGCH